VKPSPAIGVAYFLDVGQGNAALLKINNRVVVIDCGETGLEVQALLQRWSVNLIDKVILTHNDADHAKGLHRLLNSYSGKIDEVWLLIDASLTKGSSGQARKNLFTAIHGAEKGGRIQHVAFLAAGRNNSLVLLDEPPFQLRLLYPQAGATLGALLSGNANNACAVLELTCNGTRRILFGGDAPLPVWQQLACCHGLNGSLDCDILLVPHHGGHIHPNASALSKQDLLNDLTAFYRTTVRCRYAVISVGTTRNHGHPFREHVEAIRRSGASILCTQITKQCHPSVNTLPPSLLKAEAGTPQHSSRGGSARGCAGTVRIDLVVGQTFTPARTKLHATEVDKLHLAMCRRAFSLPVLPATGGKGT
jgi:competence protein ComEC